MGPFNVRSDNRGLWSRGLEFRVRDSGFRFWRFKVGQIRLWVFKVRVDVELSVCSNKEKFK